MDSATRHRIIKQTTEKGSMLRVSLWWIVILSQFWDTWPAVSGQRTSSPVMRKPLNAVQTISLHVGCIRAQSPRPPLATAPERSLGTVLGKNCLTLTWGFIQQQWHVSSGARHVLYLVVIFFMVLGFYIYHEAFMMFNKAKAFFILNFNWKSKKYLSGL